MVKKMSAEKRAISCKELRESFAAYLDDRLTPDERARIESHLSGCRQCSEELDSAAGVRDRLMKASGTLSDRITPSSDMWLDIRRRIAAEERMADSVRGISGFNRRREKAMKALFSRQPVWRLALVGGIVIITLIVGLTLGIPSNEGETAYAQVEQIVKNNQEVKAAVGGNFVYVDAISMQDNVGAAVCSGPMGEMAAVTVDLVNMSVTDVSPIDLTNDEKQQAVAIAMADSRIKDLVDQGAVLGEVSPDYALGNNVSAGTRYVLANVMITASMRLTLGERRWDISVDLDEGKVQSFYELPKLPVMPTVSPEERQRIINITEADPRVKELLDQGAVIARVGSVLAYADDGKLEYTAVDLTLGDRRWQVGLDVIEGKVTSVTEQTISDEEFESLISKGYAMGPFEAKGVLDIVKADDSVRALMVMGAEVISIRPVTEWKCDTVGNESGVQQQVCHQVGGEVKRVDVMLGMGITWWDVIVDLDSRKVAEIKEYTYDSGQGSQEDNVSGSTKTAAGWSVDWKTNVVNLSADDFYIEAGGVKYVANVTGLEITSDPGDAASCTLELIWNEHGNEMRLNMYFRSDGTYWWANEIRTYDSQSPNSDWIYYTGVFFKSKLGSAFAGDVDLTCDANSSIQGKIHFKGLELQPFLNAK